MVAGNAPYWAKGMVVTARIGDHIFYKKRSSVVQSQLEAVRRIE